MASLMDFDTRKLARSALHMPFLISSCLFRTSLAGSEKVEEGPGVRCQQRAHRVARIGNSATYVCLQQ
jgi:hypothetical protein